MRIVYFSFTIVVLLTLGISYYLIPSNDEVALMSLKNKRFSVAYSLYNSNYDSEKSSANTTLQLARLHLHFARPRSAAQVLEDYLARDPGNYEVLQYLKDLFHDQQCTSCLTGVLGRLLKIKKDKDLLQELSVIYAVNYQPDREIEVLEELVEISEASERDFIRLVKLWLSKKDFASAKNNLDQLKSSDDLEFPFEALQLVVTLLEQQVEGDRIKLATLLPPYLNRYSNRFDDVDSRLRAAYLLQSKGLTRLGLKSLGNFNREVALNNRLLKAYIALSSTIDKEQTLIPKLQRLWSKGLLPDPVIPDFIKFLAQYDHLALLKKVLETAPYELLPEETLLLITEKALITADNWLLDFIMKKDDAGTNQHRTLSIFLQVWKGELKQRQKFQGLIKAEGFSLRQKQYLLSLLDKSGKRDLAFALVDTFTDFDALSDYVVALSAKLYLENHPGKGWRILSDAVKTRDSSEIRRLWAIEMLKRKAGTGLLDWLEKNRTSQDFLVDLFFTARNAADPETALAIAERLYAQEQSVRNTTYLASACLESEMPDRAAELYSTISVPEEFEGNYLEALAKAELNPQRRQELKRLLGKQLAAVDLSEKRKQELAFLLLEKLNNKKLAINLFVELASNAAPDSQEVQRLLYLWGPRPPKRAIKWLRRRTARAKDSQERSAWLKILLKSGDRKYAPEMLEKNYSEMTSDLQDVYLDLLRTVDDPKQARAMITNLLDLNLPAEQLVKLGLVAESHSFEDLLEAVYRQAVSSYPDFPPTYKKLAFLLIRQNRSAEVRNLLKRYLELNAENQTEEDRELYLVHFHYGLLLNGSGQVKQARKHFLKSLKLIESIPGQNFRIKVAKASLLSHLDRKEEAIVLLRELVKVKPADDHLRADLVNLLIEERRYQEAEKFID